MLSKTNLHQKNNMASINSNPLWKKESNTGLYTDLDKFPGVNFMDQENIIKGCFEGAAKIIKDNNQSAMFRMKGNQLFVDQKYYEAMRLYNKSICYAETDSEALGLSYGNRSTCFLHLGMYTECLADIELAKKSKYPDASMHKLDRRQVECKKLMSEPNSVVEKFYCQEPTLSAGIKESTKYAGVADFLEIRQNTKFGRHIVTSRDLKIGDTIMMEKPYLIAPRRFSDVYGRCSHCFKLYMNFIPCDKCVNSLYCSEECLAIEKESFHKYECKLPNNISRMETFELVYNMLLKVIFAFPNIDDLMRTVESLLNGDVITDGLSTEQLHFVTIFQLTTNKNKILQILLRRMVAASNVTSTALLHFPDLKRKFPTKRHQRFLDHLVLHHFHIANYIIDLGVNSHTNINNQLNKMCVEIYGYAMYTMSSFINHSCVPNVVFAIVDDRMICKVLRPIKANQQLFRMYSNQFLSHGCDPITKMEFVLRFNFECKCPICPEPWDHSAQLAAEDELFCVTVGQMTEKTMKEYCAIPKNKLKFIERKSIELLEKYDQTHPCEQTLLVQSYLCVYWKLMNLRRLE